ncbi:hypothetical protein [Janthinobacterium psychrotolerans]|uniref:hypothetical protein n=1 Tax=Janthinobacterium psychrotolerans TaxID=1747903 RepID=UPI00080672F9|nr:hypothetical protein [Janthinobacterium psychrotolerans]
MDTVGYGTWTALAPVWGSAAIAIIAILQAFASSGVSDCSHIVPFHGAFELYENHHEIGEKDGFVAE